MEIRAHNLNLMERAIYFSERVEINPNRPEPIIIKSGSIGSEHINGE